MHRRSAIIPVCLAIAIALPAIARSEPLACAALAQADLSRTPDAPTRVVSATEVTPPDGRPYCEIRGFVAPATQFVVQLPREHWNGRFLELGCGGACGSTAHVAGCAQPVQHGYACAVNDGGHVSGGADVLWAWGNPGAVTEYFVRASHVTALAAKALAKLRYGAEPTRSYFQGCSAGGMQAMLAAQRFPWDFDGIVAGAPALNLSHTALGLAWINRQLTRADGEPRFAAADIERLHRAVLARCDADDGVADGVVGEPLACRFDPAELECRGDRTADCLSADQVRAAQAIYAGPTASDGAPIAPSSALPGSELTWLTWFSGSATHPSVTYQYVGDWFRYALFDPPPGPAWTLAQLDFDRDPRRLGLAELAQPSTDRDLRRYAARGGKLLMYTGSEDALDNVRNTVDYYETAERIVGDRARTQAFLRLYVVPGMGHCGGGTPGGDDGPWLVDWLGALEAWVEHGTPPERIDASRIRIDDLDLGKPADLATARRRFQLPVDPAAVARARPVYPYPTRTRYRGRGDASKADSFAPQPAR